MVAALFDLLDGFMARLLKVDSPLGAQLDSFADLITFGLLLQLLFLIWFTINSILFRIR